MDFMNIKRSTSDKKKLMLWIGTDIVETFEAMDPAGITVQEKMRQVLRHFVEGGFDTPAIVHSPAYHDDLADL